jgi:predicted secreted acid phosphatase
MGRGSRTIRGLGLLAAGAVLGSSLVAVAAETGPESRSPDPSVSIRETGVGLPRIGASGTLGIGEFTTAVRSYHDSGAYPSDLEAVGAKAEAFVVKQSAAIRAQDQRACSKAKKKRKKKAKTKGKRRGKKRRKAPKACREARDTKLAITLDIDETSLSNYQELQAANFTGAVGALALATITADSPAIQPTLQLYRAARARGIAVFFITGRPDISADVTVQNLNAAGYTDRAGISFKPTDAQTIPYKSGERAKIEQQGYRIIANVGDQESDLAGGYADRSFKLPNPFYFIG